MNALLIKSDSKSNKEIYKLAKKLGSKVYSVDENLFEDITLGLLMNKVKTNQLVTKEEVIKKLKK